jgi:hypothetical protein
MDMVRTQIQRTEQQAQDLKRLADEMGVSMAELVRRGVDMVIRSTGLAYEERKRRALSVSGRFHSGVRDLLRRHDDEDAAAAEA